MTNAEVLHQVDHGYRMQCPQGCPRALYDIMLECWHKDPVKRPTFETLQWKLEDFFTMSDSEYRDATAYWKTYTLFLLSIKLSCWIFYYYCYIYTSFTPHTDAIIFNFEIKRQILPIFLKNLKIPTKHTHTKIISFAERFNYWPFYCLLEYFLAYFIQNHYDFIHKKDKKKSSKIFHENKKKIVMSHQ